MLYKVAKSLKARRWHFHFTLTAARLDKKERGSEYHIYKTSGTMSEGKTVWEKVE